VATNGELIQRWFEEVWNLGREATIDELCAKHGIGRGQTIDGSSIEGPENFKMFWKALRSAFSSIHVEAHRVIEQGDLAMLQWTITMTHSGEFMGILATGKKVTATGMSLQRYEKGKIVEAWDNWDQLGALAQLGGISREQMAMKAIAKSEGLQRKSA
jgi:predicted ester cyclase